MSDTLIHRSKSTLFVPDFKEKAGTLLLTPYRKLCGGHTEVWEVKLKGKEFTDRPSKKTDAVARAVLIILGAALVIPLIMTLTGKVLLHYSDSHKKIKGAWEQYSLTKSPKPEQNTTKKQKKRQVKQDPKPVVLESLPTDSKDQVYKRTNIDFKKTCDQYGYQDSRVIELYNKLLENYNISVSVLEVLKEKKLPDMKTRVIDLMTRISDKLEDFGEDIIGLLVGQQFLDAYISWVTNGWVKDTVFRSSIDKLKNDEQALIKMFSSLSSNKPYKVNFLRYILAEASSELLIKSALDQFGAPERTVFLSKKPNEDGAKAASNIVPSLDMKKPEDKALLINICRVYKGSNQEIIATKLVPSQFEIVKDLIKPVALVTYAVKQLIQKVQEDGMNGDKLLELVSHVPKDELDTFFKLLKSQQQDLDLCYKKLIEACPNPNIPSRFNPFGGTSRKLQFDILNAILNQIDDSGDSMKCLSYFKPEQIMVTLKETGDPDGLLKKILWSLNTAQMIEVIGSTTLRKTVKNVLVTIDKYPIAPDISLEQLQERRTKLVSTLINAFNTIKGYSSDHLRKKFAVALALLGDAKKFCNAYPDKVSQTINKTLLEYHQQVDRKPLIEAFAKKLLALKGEKAQAIRKALPESITSSGSTGTQPENVNIEKPARLDDHSISNFREDP